MFGNGDRDNYGPSAGFIVMTCGNIALFIIILISLFACLLSSMYPARATNGETPGAIPKVVELKTANPEVVVYRYFCEYESCVGHDLENVNSSDELPFCSKAPDTVIDLTFLGDCLLASSKGQVSKGSFSSYALNKDPSYFFEKVYDTLSADDFTIANLENVLTDRNLVETKKEGRAFWFKGPTNNTEILKAGSIEVVSISNNHTNDYGAEGKADTIEALNNAGIEYGDSNKTLYLEKNGHTIALICNGLWYEGQEQVIIDRIKEASTKSEYQIVYYHGGTENEHRPEEWRVRASHRMVDGGADLVIGNHPHVLQPTEVYKGTNIIYSLGNFCFGGNRKPENRTIMYKVLLTVDKSGKYTTETEIIPCYVYTGEVNNWQPAPITDKIEQSALFSFMEKGRGTPY